MLILLCLTPGGCKHLKALCSTCATYFAPSYSHMTDFSQITVPVNPFCRGPPCDRILTWRPLGEAAWVCWNVGVDVEGCWRKPKSFFSFQRLKNLQGEPEAVYQCATNNQQWNKNLHWFSMLPPKVNILFTRSTCCIVHVSSLVAFVGFMTHEKYSWTFVLQWIDRNNQPAVRNVWCSPTLHVERVKQKSTQAGN